MSRRIAGLGLALPLLVCATAGAAQQPMALARLEGAIRLDGLSDEPAWQAVAPLPMAMYQPTFGGRLTERTEVRVAYDTDHIYVAGRLYDSDPTGIRANTLYRERYSGDDTFGFILDTFNDNENAIWFFTTPEGVRFDVAVSNDAEARGVNFDFNTHWDVATQRNGEGWFVEMRIPFSSLAFAERAGRVEMGFITYRYIARRAERHIYPAIPPNWERGFAKPSVAQDVVLENIRPRKPVYVTPYALGGLEQPLALNGDATGYSLESDGKADVGVDFKYRFTSNLTLDATINTDFAQVEADDQQINLTRFSLFFPEKRQFFLERAGIFDVRYAGQSRLFHSRRIGLDESARPVRILGGARLIGRAGVWDLGFLNMQTASRDSIPSENFGVLRVRRQVFDSVSNLGAMLTSRIGDDGRYNMVYGVDGTVRVVGDEYLTVKWAQSFEGGGEIPRSSRGFNSGRAFAMWERRNLVGLSYDGTVSWSGTEFNPGIGFETRRDFTFLQNGLRYQWFMGEQGRLRRILVGNESNAFLRNSDREAESAAIEPFIELETKTGASGRFSSSHNYEDVREPFALDEGVQIPVGRYWFHEVALSYEAPLGLLFRPDFALGAGSFYDGWKVSIVAGPSWVPSRHVELSLSYDLRLIRFPDRDQSLDAHVGRFHVQAALNRHASATAFVQYNSVLDLVGVNLRLRYHFREGNDLWLVYDEGLNTERIDPFDRRLPVTNGRSLLIKFTSTFIF